MLRCFICTVMAIRPKKTATTILSGVTSRESREATKRMSTDMLADNIVIPSFTPPSLGTWLLMGLMLLAPSVSLADDVNSTSQESSTLQLESEVYLPDDLWPEKAYIEAPSAAVIPPEPLAPPPLEPINVMLDWFLSPQHAPLLIAYEKGFFQRQGLEVRWQIPGDPSLPTKLLAAGEVDLALGRQPLLHLAVHGGASLTRIATLVNTPLNAIITLGDDPKESLEQLGTRPLGFTTQEGQQLILPLLISEIVSQSEQYAKPQAVHFETVQSLTVGGLEGIADAFFHTLPSRLSTQGQPTTVTRYDALSIPRHDGLIVMANRNTLGNRMETCARFVIALEDAVNWIIENPESAMETMITAYPRLENSVTTDSWEDILRRFSLTPAALDLRRYQDMETFLHQHDITSEILPVEQLAVDPNRRH